MMNYKSRKKSANQQKKTDEFTKKRLILNQ